MDGLAKPRILIADDSEMNRAILTDMLEEEYDILEAENGVEAVALLERHAPTLSLVLLDIIMPEMDGFGVLDEMNARGWIRDVPVIMISSESRSSAIERAYSLGVTDYINRPFDSSIVHHRVVNTILLYAKQKKLIALVEAQVRENTKQNTMMIDILSHIVEFRNGESGMHVLHIRLLTELFLRHLSQTGQYPCTQQDISRISNASALHDIGKIAIPSHILNKPGRFTDEEFAIMKTHSAIGSDILKGLVNYRNEPLVQTAYEICRWHHERYDGRGYPDGLKGDEIPLTAQIVALADVYDALTSPRVYKDAIPHEKAVHMIQNGECGTFNPMLLECLGELSDRIREAYAAGPSLRSEPDTFQRITDDILRQEDLSDSTLALDQVERERLKQELLNAMNREVQFEYSLQPPSLLLSAYGARRLGLSETVSDPLSDDRVRALLDASNGAGHLLGPLRDDALAASADQGPVERVCRVALDGQPHWVRLLCQVLRDSKGEPVSIIGKLIDVQEAKANLEALEKLAFVDTLTGLYNRAYGEERIRRRLEGEPWQEFTMSILDLDDFKQFNDRFGHQYGDRVLIELARRLRHVAGNDALVARFGGDEFLIFTPCVPDYIQRIQEGFDFLNRPSDEFSFSVSAGIVTTADVGRRYEDLFLAADQALYATKRSGSKNRLRFYDPSIRDMFSAHAYVAAGDRKE